MCNTSVPRSAREGMREVPGIALAAMSPSTVHDVTPGVL